MSGAAWMAGEFAGVWIQVCVWLSPFTVHLSQPKYKIKSLINVIRSKKSFILEIEICPFIS